MLSRRTVVVVSLLAVAVLVPSSAWWLSAAREATRREQHLVTETEERLDRELAERATFAQERLEKLRQSESLRPFYHYQNLTHEPRGASQGLSIIPSPLANGVADPLIRAHFQIAPDGHINLPTVNEDFPEFSTEEGFAMYCSLLGELEQAVTVDDGDLVSANSSGSDLSDSRHRELRDRGRVVVLEGRQWHQIEEANQLYAALAGREPASFDAVQESPLTGDSPVSVLVGPLSWHTILIGSGPMLAALRQVDTPSGVLVQGFAIATTMLREGLLESMALSFEPNGAVGANVLASPVGDTGWSLTVDPRTARVAAVHQAMTERTAFRQRFALVLAAALCAAACVAVIVAEVERMARQRERFAAAAAHELKTPLATLQLYSEMLADGLGDPTRTAEYGERVAQEASRLGRVVTNILDLSRFERGAPLAHPQPGNLGEAVASCVERLRPTLSARGMELVFTPQPALPDVLFDRDALHQIVANLLDNAERYCRGCEDRRVEIDIAIRGGWARISVHDNGPGVSEAARRRIFRAFTRGEGATASQGLGLGLALARALARAQGGELELEPSVGGANFVLSLALSSPPAASHLNPIQNTHSL